jgi:hypothetical protein
MAIIQTIDNASQFRDQFHHCGRNDQFSYEALGLIFDYLSDCGSDVELDVVGICCEFAEQHYSDFAEAYGVELSPEDSEQEHIQQVKDFIESASILVGQTSDQCNLVYVQF